MRIAFLGTGRMGGPMAANLLRAGFPLTVWNRTPGRAAALVAAGAVPAATPREAVAGADVVVTMLADGAATWAVATGPDGLLAGAGPNLLWAQMGTVGLHWTDLLAGAAAACGVCFVDAPVAGGEGLARVGGLTVLAGGPDGAKLPLMPVFDAVGSRTVWLGDAGAGIRAKLVLSTWLMDVAGATAEIIAFARCLDLEPATMLRVLESSPLESGYAARNVRSTLARLALEAAHAAGADLALTKALLRAGSAPPARGTARRT